MSRTWLTAVKAACDAVFEASDAGFVPNDGGFEDALLWEADPEAFALRYPDNDLRESYGSSWPPPCIDYWLYVDADGRRVRFSVEGWPGPDVEFALSGDPDRDASAIAGEFARILRVELPPRAESTGL